MSFPEYRRPFDIEAPWVGQYYDKYRNDFYGLVEPEEIMSDLWAYNPDKCDGDICYMDCDCCPKSVLDDDEEVEDADDG